jgi:hypothetical protein
MTVEAMMGRKSNSDTTRACYPRRRFATQSACLTAASRISQQESRVVYAEPCSDCNGWHLSRKKQ